MQSHFLDLADPTFDVTGPDVINAREQSWWARSSYGHAVFRHAEVTALLKDRRFQQGNAQWPAQNGVHSGMFNDWWHKVGRPESEWEQVAHWADDLGKCFGVRIKEDLLPRSGPGTVFQHSLVFRDPELHLPTGAHRR